MKHVWCVYIKRFFFTRTDTLTALCQPSLLITSQLLPTALCTGNLSVNISSAHDFESYNLAAATAIMLL